LRADLLPAADATKMRALLLSYQAAWWNRIPTAAWAQSLHGQ
jgi:hypothetical protein